MGFFIYILQSDLDATFYIGFSTDLQRRIEEHNAGLCRYTSRKCPWRMVYHEQFETKTEALKRERFLKKMRNADFYRRLIQNKPG